MALIGHDGPAVVISAKTARFLEERAGLAALRVRARGVMPDVAADLADIRRAAELYSPLPHGPEVEGDSAEVAQDSEEWLTSTEVADMAQVSDRAVRLACADGRLDGQQHQGRWRVPATAAREYAANRRSA